MGLRSGRAWWWTAIAGIGRDLVLVRDHDVDRPRGGGLEIRAPGLWAEPVCETPLEHWSLGLEAMAVSLDDPVEAYGSERGEPVPLGLDLEWEASADPAAWPGGSRYGQPCQVHGEVLVGRERLAIVGSGVYEHRWGPRDWWGQEETWAAARFEDGTWLGPGPQVEATAELDGTGLIAAGHVLARPALLTPVAHTPIQIPDGPAGAVSRLARALCRVEGEDGRTGWGWIERLQPASSTLGA